MLLDSIGRIVGSSAVRTGILIGVGRVYDAIADRASATGDGVPSVSRARLEGRGNVAL